MLVRKQATVHTRLRYIETTVSILIRLIFRCIWLICCHLKVILFEQKDRNEQLRRTQTIYFLWLFLKKNLRRTHSIYLELWTWKPKNCTFYLLWVDWFKMFVILLSCMYQTGTVLGFSYAQTRNLLTPITLHAFWNSGVIVFLIFLQVLHIFIGIHSSVALAQVLNPKNTH